MAHVGFVVGIDFGTTYSGYAFSCKQDLQNSPPTISTSIWQGGRLLSLKAPTSVLLNNNEELVAFGYEAENRFSDILADEEHEDYYYFRHFKMLLHKQRITKTTEITDASGKSMKAIKVFSKTIKYLKKEVEMKIQERVRNLPDNYIHFVLTVPAILGDPAKQFMREAAEKAGINTERLAIALESEAASIYCQELKTVDCSGKRYMVIDLGGGTVDITFHQRRPDGTIEEVMQPYAGPWGGKSIDEAFSKFMADIYGQDVMRELKAEELEEYIDLFREFETKKRSIKTDQTSNVVITLPVSLIDLVKKKHTKFEYAMENSRYKHNVNYAKQKLHISPDVFRDLFNNTIKEIIKCVERLLKDPKLPNTDTILMVGGFSECDLVQKAMKTAIGKTMKLIIPEEAGIAVMKGAVLFGYQTKVVCHRIARYTYGIQGWADWDPDMHPKAKKVTINGQVKCQDVFIKYVTKGEQIKSDHEVSRIFQVLKPEESTYKCMVYISSDENPRYITDPSCRRIGILEIQLPPHIPGQTLEVEFTLIFGDSELLCRARDLRTGRISEVQFDLL